MTLRVRAFLGCWAILAAHFATNIVREHYPAMTLADSGTLRVDPYVGLHPDLFATPGGAAFINSNPGTSMLAALPLLAFRPLTDLAERHGRARAAAGRKVDAPYLDDRVNRVRFYHEARRRGLEVKFAVVAVATAAFFMAPLTALAAPVLAFFLESRRGLPRPAALAWGTFVVLATPLFFRSGHLNQNQMVALLTLFGFVTLAARPALVGAEILAGAFAGIAVLCDYSGLVALAGLALLASSAPVSSEPSRVEFGRTAVARLARFAAGAAPALAVLAAYQWWAFGSPVRPAQAAMPPTPLSVHGYSGLSWPQPDLIWANLFDPRFGLFTFAPVLLVSVPGWVSRPRWLTRPEFLVAGALSVGFLLFSSANQYARLQWNTGFRYLAPVVPMLFLLTIHGLERLPLALSRLLLAAAVLHAWVLAMVRDSVVESWRAVVTDGPQLPWLTVLSKMPQQEIPWLERAPAAGIVTIILVGTVVWLWWPLGGGFLAAARPTSARDSCA